MKCRQNCSHKRTKVILEEAPDGGWGWMIVIASFVGMFIIRGTQNAIGVFFAGLVKYFEEGAGTTAWMASMFSSLSLCVGPFAAAISQRFSHRTSVMAGGFLTALAAILSSFADDIYTLTLGFGIFAGIFLGFCRLPHNVMVGRYFQKRLARASGISIIGSGLGAFVMAPLLQFCLTTYGWRGTLLIFGGIFLNLCVTGALLRPIYLKGDFPEEGTGDENEIQLIETGHSGSLQDQSQHRCTICDKPKSCCVSFVATTNKYFDFGLFKDRFFALIIVARLILSFGINIPLIHLVSMAMNTGILPQNAAFLMSIFGICAMVGSFGQGFIVDPLRLSHMQTYGAAMAAYGLIIVVLPLVRGYVAFAVVIGVMGIVRGVATALDAPMIKEVVTEGRFTNAYGFSLMFTGITQVLGPPVAGYIYDKTGNYSLSFFIGGATIVVGSLLLVALACMRRRWRPRAFQLKELNQAMMEADSAQGNTCNTQVSEQVACTSTEEADQGSVPEKSA